MEKIQELLEQIKEIAENEKVSMLIIIDKNGEGATEMSGNYIRLFGLVERAKFQILHSLEQQEKGRP